MIETDIAASSNMSALVRAKDWSKTALGEAHLWPTSLKLVVELVLASGFPMAVRWGPDFVMIYNDAYRPILGDKHPQALGMPFRIVWPEVQAKLAPLHESILSGERSAFFAQDLLLEIQRHGSPVGGGAFYNQLQSHPGRLGSRWRRRGADHGSRDHEQSVDGRSSAEERGKIPIRDVSGSDRELGGRFRQRDTDLDPRRNGAVRDRSARWFGPRRRAVG